MIIPDFANMIAPSQDFVGSIKQPNHSLLCNNHQRSSTILEVDHFGRTTLLCTRSKTQVTQKAQQCETKHPLENSTLALLDMKVKINTNSSPQFEFYKKGAKKDLIINYKSGLPVNLKLNVIRNERNRINQRCSYQESIIK